MLNITKIVGDKIRRLRLEATMSQSDLAACLKMSSQNVCSLEKGKRGLSSRQIELLCECFGCLPADLFAMPDDVHDNHIMRQLRAEMKIMTREDIAKLCAYAVSMNAARGVKPAAAI